MSREGAVNLLHNTIDVPLAFIRDRVREFLERGGVDLCDAKEQCPSELVLTVQVRDVIAIRSTVRQQTKGLFADLNARRMTA
jgi:hypothetical protein